MLRDDKKQKDPTYTERLYILTAKYPAILATMARPSLYNLLHDANSIMPTSFTLAISNQVHHAPRRAPPQALRPRRARRHMRNALRRATQLDDTTRPAIVHTAVMLLHGLTTHVAHDAAAVVAMKAFRKEIVPKLLQCASGGQTESRAAAHRPERTARTAAACTRFARSTLTACAPPAVRVWQ
eukprot:7384232-Prymnesium_polylepis.1